MFELVLYILGALLLVGGLAGMYFTQSFKPIIEKEIELMKRGGKFEGEPEYMRRFRVARSEWDLVANRRHFATARAASIIGVFILLGPIVL